MKTARIGINESHAVHFNAIKHDSLIETSKLGSIDLINLPKSESISMLSNMIIETSKLGSIDLITFT